MIKKEDGFVWDAKKKPLSPTPVGNAWYLIRKKKALLVSRYPMVIQLIKVVGQDEIDPSHFVAGIDDGSSHAGIAIVQKCLSKNKVVFKGTIELRQDVTHRMDTRRSCRRYHRAHKRYRPARFNNRSSSKREGRIPPSVLQKKQAILRVLSRLNKWLDVKEYHLEDVAIDIRAMTDGFKPYRWQYQKTNRLDENLRKGVILRDGGTCQECGKNQLQA